MQFFFRGLLVAGITYFLKLGHNNHVLIFTIVTLGLLRAVETVGLLRAVETMGLLRVVEQWAFYGLYHQWALYGPYDRLAKHGQNRPHSGRKRARVGYVCSWADRNGPSLIGRI